MALQTIIYYTNGPTDLHSDDDAHDDNLQPDNDRIRQSNNSGMQTVIHCIYILFLTISVLTRLQIYKIFNYAILFQRFFAFSFAETAEIADEVIAEDIAL